MLGYNDRESIAGTFGSARKYNYNASASHSDQPGIYSSASANVGWQAPAANPNAGYSYGSHFRQGSIGASVR